MNSEKETLGDNVKWLAIGLIAAFVFLQFLGYAFGTKSPIVAVVSSSMRHDSGNFDSWLSENGLIEKAQSWPFSNGFREGDMIIIVGANRESIKVGDVIIYGQPQDCHPVNPIIHRVVGLNNEGLIVKGDNNNIADCGGNPVPYEWVQGKAVVAVPDAGLPRYMLRKIIGV